MTSPWVLSVGLQVWVRTTKIRTAAATARAATAVTRDATAATVSAKAQSSKNFRTLVATQLAQ
jgi:hypothetical protein